MLYPATKGLTNKKKLFLELACLYGYGVNLSQLGIPCYVKFLIGSLILNYFRREIKSFSKPSELKIDRCIHDTYI